MQKSNKNKTKYIIFWCIGFLSAIVPVLIFNLINYKMFQKVDGQKLTYAGVLGFAMVSIAMLAKIKSKGSWYSILAGAVIVVIGELATQVGWSMILLGGGIMLDKILWSKIAFIYKERWYGETGRRITYTRAV